MLANFFVNIKTDCQKNEVANNNHTPKNSCRTHNNNFNNTNLVLKIDYFLFFVNKLSKKNSSDITLITCVSGTNNQIVLVANLESIENY